MTDNRFWRRSLGSEQRIWSLHAHLVSGGWKVAVVFVGDFTDTDRAQLAESRLEAVHDLGSRLLPLRFHVKRAIARVCTALRRGHVQVRTGSQAQTDARPAPRAFYVSAALRALLDRVMLEVRPDVVILEYLRLASLVPVVRQHASAHCRVVLDSNDVMHQRTDAFAARGLVAELPLSREAERSLLLQFDCIMAITETDRRAFLTLVPERAIITVPHAVAAPRQGRGRAAGGGIRFGFIGSGMGPNVDAVRHLMSDIWPRVVASEPSASLCIAGAVSEPFEAQHLPPRVELLGRVASLDEFYSKVDATVSPVRFGSGLKVKNIESLAFGVPVLTYPEGATGMDDYGADGYTIHETPEALTTAMIAYAQDAALRASLQQRAAQGAGQLMRTDRIYAALDAYLSSADSRAPGVANRST